MSTYWGIDPERVSAWCGYCGEQIADGISLSGAETANIAHQNEHHGGFRTTAILDNFDRADSPLDVPWSTRF